RRDQGVEVRGFVRLGFDELDVLVVEETRFRRSAAYDVDAVAACDAHDPARERLCRVVSVERPIGADEGLLSGVVGRPRASEQLPAQTADAPIVAAIKLLEVR